VSLRLEIDLPAGPLRRSGPTPVPVALINDGPGPVLVSRRMAPGYLDSVSREVYFDLDGPFAAQKYQRDPAAPTDYGWLGPGERVVADIDLLDWYLIREPGEYRLTGHYQCDEPLADPPAGIVPGVLDSPTYSITVE